MSPGKFWGFCRDNPMLQVERNAEGDIVLMPSSDAWTVSRSGELLYQLSIWDKVQTAPGLIFGGAVAFTLPNGAERSPDMAWIAQERWNAVHPRLRRRFPHISPDFVTVMMSPDELLEDVRPKMEEYRANGVRLGWLIDRKNQTVYVYRPGETVAVFDNIANLSGSLELPGFTANLQQVFLQDTD